jgi:hypothetical protein
MHNGGDDVLVRSALQEAFPSDCARVGKANLTDIVQRKGNVRLAELGAPSRLDWSLSLSLLAASAAIGNHALSILKSVRNTPTKDQKEVALEIKLSLPRDLAEKLSASDLERLLASLIKCAAPPDSDREH